MTDHMAGTESQPPNGETAPPPLGDDSYDDPVGGLEP